MDDTHYSEFYEAIGGKVGLLIHLWFTFKAFLTIFLYQYNLSFFIDPDPVGYGPAYDDGASTQTSREYTREHRGNVVMVTCLIVTLGLERYDINIVLGRSVVLLLFYVVLDTVLFPCLLSPIRCPIIFSGWYSSTGSSTRPWTLLLSSCNLETESFTETGGRWNEYSLFSDVPLFIASMLLRGRSDHLRCTQVKYQ